MAKETQKRKSQPVRRKRRIGSSAAYECGAREEIEHVASYLGGMLIEMKEVDRLGIKMCFIEHQKLWEARLGRQFYGYGPYQAYALHALEENLSLWLQTTLPASL